MLIQLIILFNINFVYYLSLIVNNVQDNTIFFFKHFNIYYNISVLLLKLENSFRYSVTTCEIYYSVLNF